MKFSFPRTIALSLFVLSQGFVASSSSAATYNNFFADTCTGTGAYAFGIFKFATAQRCPRMDGSFNDVHQWVVCMVPPNTGNTSPTNTNVLNNGNTLTLTNTNNNYFNNNNAMNIAVYNNNGNLSCRQG